MAVGWMTVKVKDLIKAEWNYKGDDDNKFRQLKNNIQRNGLIENLIIREVDNGLYEVVNGNHRFDVIRELGYKEVMVFNFGVIPLTLAKRIAVETNETKFDVDTLKFAHLMVDLVAEFGKDDLLLTMPFDEKKIDDYDKLINYDWDKETEVSGATKEQSETDLVTLNVPVAVADEFNDQITRIKKLLFPAEKPKDVSYITPIKTILSILEKIDDKRLLGFEPPVHSHIDPLEDDDTEYIEDEIVSFIDEIEEEFVEEDQI